MFAWQKRLIKTEDEVILKVKLERLFPERYTFSELDLSDIKIVESSTTDAVNGVPADDSNFEEGDEDKSLLYEERRIEDEGRDIVVYLTDGVLKYSIGDIFNEQGFTEFTQIATGVVDFDICKDLYNYAIHICYTISDKVFHTTITQDGITSVDIVEHAGYEQITCRFVWEKLTILTTDASNVSFFVADGLWNKTTRAISGGETLPQISYNDIYMYHSFYISLGRIVFYRYDFFPDTDDQLDIPSIGLLFASDVNSNVLLQCFNSPLAVHSEPDGVGFTHYANKDQTGSGNSVGILTEEIGKAVDFKLVLDGYGSRGDRYFFSYYIIDTDSGTDKDYALKYGTVSIESDWRYLSPIESGTLLEDNVPNADNFSVSVGGYRSTPLAAYNCLDADQLCKQLKVAYYKDVTDPYDNPDYILREALITTGETHGPDTITRTDTGEVVFDSVEDLENFAIAEKKKQIHVDESSDVLFKTSSKINVTKDDLLCFASVNKGCNSISDVPWPIHMPEEKRRLIWDFYDKEGKSILSNDKVGVNASIDEFVDAGMNWKPSANLYGKWLLCAAYRGSGNQLKFAKATSTLPWTAEEWQTQTIDPGSRNEKTGLWNSLVIQQNFSDGGYESLIPDRAKFYIAYYSIYGENPSGSMQEQLPNSGKLKLIWSTDTNESTNDQPIFSKPLIIDENGDMGRWTSAKLLSTDPNTIGIAYCSYVPDKSSKDRLSDLYKLYYIECVDNDGVISIGDRVALSNVIEENFSGTITETFNAGDITYEPYRWGDGARVIKLGETHAIIYYSTYRITNYIPNPSVYLIKTSESLFSGGFGGTGSGIGGLPGIPVVGTPGGSGGIPPPMVSKPTPPPVENGYMVCLEMATFNGSSYDYKTIYRYQPIVFIEDSTGFPARITSSLLCMDEYMNSRVGGAYGRIGYNETEDGYGVITAADFYGVAIFKSIDTTPDWEDCFDTPTEPARSSFNPVYFDGNPADLPLQSQSWSPSQSDTPCIISPNELCDPYFSSLPTNSFTEDCALDSYAPDNNHKPTFTFYTSDKILAKRFYDNTSFEILVKYVNKPDGVWIGISDDQKQIGDTSLRCGASEFNRPYYKTAADNPEDVFDGNVASAYILSAIKDFTIDGESLPFARLGDGEVENWTYNHHILFKDKVGPNISALVHPPELSTMVDAEPKQVINHPCVFFNTTNATPRSTYGIELDSGFSAKLAFSISSIWHPLANAIMPLPKNYSNAMETWVPFTQIDDAHFLSFVDAGRYQERKIVKIDTPNANFPIDVTNEIKPFSEDRAFNIFGKYVDDSSQTDKPLTYGSIAKIVESLCSTPCNAHDEKRQIEDKEYSNNDDYQNYIKSIYKGKIEKEIDAALANNKNVSFTFTYTRPDDVEIIETQIEFITASDNKDIESPKIISVTEVNGKIIIVWGEVVGAEFYTISVGGPNSGEFYTVLAPTNYFEYPTSLLNNSETGYELMFFVTAGTYGE